MPDINKTDLVARLREACVDWNGEPMADAEEPRRIPTCGDLLEAADAIQSLIRERDEAREGFGSLVVAVAQAGLGLRDKTPEEFAAGGDDLCKLKIVNRPLEAQAAEISRLRDALLPFIDTSIQTPAAMAFINKRLDEMTMVNVSVTKGQFRRARTALEANHG